MLRVLQLASRALVGPTGLLLFASYWVEDSRLQGLGEMIVWAVFVTALVMSLLSLDAVQKRLPVTWKGFSPAPSVSFRSDDHHFFTVVVTSKRTLREAALDIQMPADLDFVRILRKDDDRYAIRRSDGPIRWREQPLYVAGGEIPTEIRFRGSLAPGRHEIVTVLHDDSFGTLRQTEELIVEDTPEYQKMIADQADGIMRTAVQLRDYLAQFKSAIATSIAHGFWEPPMHSQGAPHPGHVNVVPNLAKVLRPLTMQWLKEAVEATNTLFQEYAVRQGEAEHRARVARHGRSEMESLLGPRSPEKILLDPKDGMTEALAATLCAVTMVNYDLSRLGEGFQ